MAPIMDGWVGGMTQTSLGAPCMANRMASTTSSSPVLRPSSPSPYGMLAAAAKCSSRTFAYTGTASANSPSRPSCTEASSEKRGALGSELTWEWSSCDMSCSPRLWRETSQASFAGGDADGLRPARGSDRANDLAIGSEVLQEMWAFVRVELCPEDVATRCSPRRVNASIAPSALRWTVRAKRLRRSRSSLKSRNGRQPSGFFS